MSTDKGWFILSRFSSIIYYASKWGQNQKKISKNIKSKRENESIFEIAFNLDDKYDKILSVLLRFPSYNKKQISEVIYPNLKNKEYEKIKHQIDDLLELGLIEVDESRLPDEIEFIGGTQKYWNLYELSLTGIIYVVLNHRKLEFLVHKPFKHLLKNYHAQHLFYFFLHPYFEKETLLKLDLDWYFLEYLVRICNTINRYMYTFNNFDPRRSPENLIDNNYLPTTIFDWPMLPSKYDYKINNKIIELLNQYLIRELKWNWLENAKFILKFQNNTIEISDKNNNAIIIISPSNKTAILRYKGNNYTNLFKVYEPHNNLLPINGKDKTVEETLGPQFLWNCRRELFTLLYDLQHICKITITDRPRQLLYKDQKYRKTIDDALDDLKIKE